MPFDKVKRLSLRSLLALILCGSAAVQVTASPALADPLRVYAAGSLVAPIKELIQASGMPDEVFADPVFGPAGLLRERIQGGEEADIYFSADLSQPRHLVEAGKGKLVIPFAKNRMCVIARRALGLTPENLLDKLLAPDLRLATSTPIADPGGDYALAVFARANAFKAGAGDILQSKSLKLLGSPNTMIPIAGRSPAATVFIANHADTLLYYCSGQASLLKEVSDLSVIRLPPLLDVPVTYGLTILSDSPNAMRFALFALSEKGQSIFERHELISVSNSGR